jgi:hypothetical protein
LIKTKDLREVESNDSKKFLIFEEAICDLSIFSDKKIKNLESEKDLKLSVYDIIYIIETVLVTFQNLLELGIAFSDLKPDNIVLVRYFNFMDSIQTLLKPCYKIKLIDLASFTYLNDIKEYNFFIEKDPKYPNMYSRQYSKKSIIGNGVEILKKGENGYEEFLDKIIRNELHTLSQTIKSLLKMSLD